MPTDLSGLLNPINKFIDHLREHPNVRDSNRNILYILSFVTVFLQSIFPLIIPEQSLVRRSAFIIITYVIVLIVALIIGQYIRPRRWLIYLSPLLIAPIMIGAIYIYVFITSNAYRLAPDFLILGRPLPYTATYGTNARILEVQAYRRNLPIGPDQFLRLKFQLFCVGVDENCNAGLIIGNLQGIENLNSVQELVFEIRGAQGGEVVGVTMKDKAFTESRIFDIGRYVPGSPGISNDWRTVRIPLTAFAPVELTTLNVVSFFVDARYYPYPIIDFDIANVRLE